MKNSIIYVIIFLGIQAAIGLITPAIWKIFSGNADITAPMLITSTVIANLLVIALFLSVRWAEVSPNWLRSRPWAVLIWSVIAALGLVIPSLWLQEHMPELPNISESQFEQLLGNRWGYLAVGLLAPLAEEIVFRGAILRALLNTRWSPWLAIAVSALLFGVAHLNPAQFPHAFIIGMLLGWMYWRTGSILPAVAYHWANNSVAFVVYHLYPDPNIHLVDVFKGSESHVLLAVVFSLLIALPALYQLHLRMRQAS